MIYVNHDNGETITKLNPIVKRVTWSGDVMQASRRIQVDLQNTLIDNSVLAVDIRHGDRIEFGLDDTELFRGIVFADRVNEKGSHTLTVYDDNIYLTKNRDTAILRNQTASQFIKKMCTKFDIDIGEIEDTGYVISKQIFRDKTLWEMFDTVLSITKEQTGKKFYMTNTQGKLNVQTRAKQKELFILENERNILNASSSKSIENMRTRVKVTSQDGNKDPISFTIKDNELESSFGVMQHLQKADRDLNNAQIQQMAKELLEELGTIDDKNDIEAIGNSSIIAGKGVYVRESMTKLSGAFYVQTDNHVFEEGTHFMTLTLSGTDELPDLKTE